MRRARAPGWAGHGDLAASLALIFPLVLAYGIGVAVVSEASAVDLVTRALWLGCGRSRDRYLLAYAVIAIGFLWWLRRHGRRGAVTLAVVVPVIAEAAIYALTMGAAIGFAIARLASLGAGTIVGAIGAGLHEELVFRLLGVAGAAALVRHLGAAPRLALAVAVIASSVVFAAAHHWAGEAWDPRVFGFRALAGGVFALIFWHRSLAHAVYAHTIYDLYVAAVTG